MSMTFSRSLAVQNAGRIASGILTLVLLVQPTSVTAQAADADAAKSGPESTVQDENPSSTQGAEKAPEPALVLPVPTAQEMLKDVCVAHGYGDECARTLLGMMWKESNNIATAVGDHGLALGYFQIHYKMHKVTRACATDLKCSAEWSLNYMEKNGYPKYVKHAVQCHNGCNIENGYAASAVRHGARLWKAPLEVTPATTTVAVAAK